MKKFVLVLVLMLLASTVLGCAAPTATPDNSATTIMPTAAVLATDNKPATKSPVTTDSANEEYVMITIYPSATIWEPAYRGFKEAGDWLGVKTSFQGPNSLEPKDEVAVMEQSVAKQAAGIAVSAVEPTSFIETINNTIAQGIPVVTFDSDSPDSNRLTFIGTSNYAAGEAAAKELAEHMNGKGDVMLLTMVGQLNHEQRASGFTDYMAANYPDIHIVANGNVTADTAASTATVASLFLAHPSVIGVFSTQPAGTIGVSQTITEMGLKNIINIGFDNDPLILAAIKEGTCTESIVQNFYIMGFEAMLQLYVAKHDLSNPYISWQEAGLPNLPANMSTGIAIVTAKNVDTFSQPK